MIYLHSEGDIMRKNSDARIKANAKYDKVNTKSVFLKLNVKTDADILEHLETVGNKQGYIKELIRKDMNGVTAAPVNKILEGSFTEGESVTVLINGEKHKRKVRGGKITILGIEYTSAAFE